jgi:hypothetical protein
MVGIVTARKPVIEEGVACRMYPVSTLTHMYCTLHYAMMLGSGKRPDSAASRILVT